ncbi:MAG: orotidine-5'-phosphate decarboxylase [Oscillospiraceae bacterium]|nr:orotidine-5'-phosphate decarboxylase [Oscillospiraceae bacterium]MDD3832580.1 orotidine-5'-phosphate decarboxylase [Oscillospiraceae bacterium]MDD4546027.1 orotidine-5'-phosphate decarboxylase [Oscillospiraceae bacterium]
MSLDRLIDAIKRTGNPSVAGLDPKLEYIPEYIVKTAFDEHGQTLEGAAEALWIYNKGIIDALCDIVPAVKPQAAYYEMYGWPGMRALALTIEYAKSKGMYVITDGKRNDIGSTMEAYASAHLGVTRVGSNKISAFGGDALTVNGYLGKDGIMPLLEVCKSFDSGIFVLVKTSNPSSGDLQDKIIEDRPVYYHMGQLCEEWGRMLPGKYGYSGVGAVVGATWPEQLSELRAQLPHTFFLVPGYGAQGGGAADVKGAFDNDGIGGVVNSSRAILCAWKKEGCAPEDYASAARREALRMKDDITAVID